MKYNEMNDKRSRKTILYLIKRITGATPVILADQLRIMDGSIIAARIKKIREYRNYTQSYVAHKLNIKQNTYSAIESGTKDIKLARLKEIAIILGVSTDHLIDDTLELFNIDKTINNSAGKQAERLIKALQEEIEYLRHQNIELIKALRELK